MILYFSLTLLFFSIIYKFLGNSFALDSPNLRKKHQSNVPQIGGIVFGPLLILAGVIYEAIPSWYIIGGFATIILGIVDDVKHISWKIKILVQIILFIFISYVHWDEFHYIKFYNLTFHLSQMELLSVFLFWFIGIYNAVNLIDGLDGLAGGFMILIFAASSLFGSSSFTEINLIFLIITLGFLYYNIRPAKLFMGDAGSLFFGFHTATLPLLYYYHTNLNNSLNMTPFILFASYLIADTIRVFITRIADKKSPMNADTIHFHHLILKQSGSYIASISSIYFITLITSIIAAMSFFVELSTNVMFIHLALILIFILTPPVQTYVGYITKTVKPLYNWQKDKNERTPYLPRTLYVIFLQICLLISLLIQTELGQIFFSLDNFLGFILFIILLVLKRNERDVLYIFLTGITIILSQLIINIDFNLITKLFLIFSIISYITFSIEKRIGCNIKKFTSLDLLIIMITIGGLTISSFEVGPSKWFYIILIAIWFNLSFIFRRTLFYNYK